MDANIQHNIDNDLAINCNEKLGCGAFGVVFRGTYKGTSCAVKILHQVATQLTSNLPINLDGLEEPNTEVFNQECDFLRSCQHPNIVEHLLTTKHPTSKALILVTEVLDCSLRSYFSSKDCGAESLTINSEISLSKDVAAGLAYLHSKLIIHRDLCGDNILLKLSQPDGVPVAKISDLGMSRLFDPSKLSHTLTAMGHRAGYLPPEAPRENGAEYDHSLDVFSLGAVMVQIICKLETIESAGALTDNVAQIPDTHLLKPLINICLQRDKDKRPLAENLCDNLESLNSSVKLGYSNVDYGGWIPENELVQLPHHQDHDRMALSIGDSTLFLWICKQVLPLVLLVLLAVMSIYYSDDLFANSDTHKGIYGDFPILKFFYNTAVTVATAGFVYIYVS